MSSLRVVLDTNVIISGMAYPASVPGKIIQAWRRGAIDVFLSEYILDEVYRVLPKLSHRHGLSEGEVDDLVDIIRFLSEIIEPAPLTAESVRDTKDTPVLGTFVAGRQNYSVDYLITGDQDLLSLADSYPIIAPAAFWKRHGGL